LYTSFLRRSLVSAIGAGLSREKWFRNAGVVAVIESSDCAGKATPIPVQAKGV
jgi:hypothetical protein